MYKVLVTDPIAEQGVEILKKQSDIDVDVKLKIKPEELKSIIGNYDALVVRSETKVTADIIEAGKNLKVIGRAGVGVDNIDVLSSSKKGIIVMNTPDGNTIATAEHTMSMIMALSRNIPQADLSVKSKKWDRKKYIGVELYGKILGIIGLGRVGKEVAIRAKSFGMEIIGYDTYSSNEMARKLEIRLVSLDELISKSDYITVHTPLTKETKHLIGEKEIVKMKEGIRLINCARGGIIDETALLNGLKSGKVAGVALDVYEVEPPPQDSPLFNLENVVLTPHLGASTEEAQISVSVAVANQIIEALRGGTIRNAVNSPSIPADILNQMKPYIDLSEILGRILVQVIEGYIKNIKVEYKGQIVDYNTSFLTLSIVKGILTPMVKEPVNFVNALLILKEKNILVSESKSNEVTHYTNFIELEITTDKDKKFSIAGTVFGKDSIRIVELGNYDIDLEPAENMLIIYNLDKPGIVGNIGTTLGQERINIASLQMARKESGGEAMTILTVDSVVNDEILKKISQIENIKEVKFVKG
ncbi:MAG: phosphoglycerate dehydrogenase [Candidatus Firestonebacteria bacterium]